MLSESYQIKEANYYQHSRPEMRSFIPTEAIRLLDVGCGRGSFSRHFKEAGKEVWGVELMPEAVAEAAKVLDRTYCGEFTTALDLPAGYFDVIIFNDVLEHMLSPDEALRYARTLLAPGGVIASSMPNFLHGPNLREVVIQRDWKYRDEGILDRTHVRFFTRKSMIRLFEDAGFTVTRCEGINGEQWTKKTRFLNWLLRGRLDEYRWLQFALQARVTDAVRERHPASSLTPQR